METQPYYINRLKDILSLRQKANPSYSIRAYARDLEINSSTLSQILSGKRSLPVRTSQVIATKLGLDEKESTLFTESINRSYLAIDQIKTAPLDERFMLDESYYKVIAEWEHYAILDLFELSDFENSPEYMACKLKLTPERIDTVLDNLIQCGLLLEDEKGVLIKVHADIRTTEDIEGEALNAAHLEELELGKQKLREVSKNLRDFSSSTYAIDPEKLSEAKTIIREFRRKMTTLLKAGDKKDVYMLAIQFFPLTDTENKDENLH
jgi:uncharacterized protein (TIGR02147 family)